MAVDVRGKLKKGKIMDFYKQTLSDKIVQSKDAIWKCDPAKTLVLWSGGKDSTVALHLALAVNKGFRVLYEDTGSEFPEIRKYVETVAQEWESTTPHNGGKSGEK
jgi:3'-phosphoadenosine 5'-phosphosulfate sulfotransferase (PAPS reductase)/FAD synthetase